MLRELRGNLCLSLLFHFLQKKCLSIREASLGDNDVTVADSLCWIGNIHREKRELDEARECFLKALSVKVAVLGKEHSECSEILQNLGEYNASD